MAGTTPLVLVCDDEAVLRELIAIALGDRFRLREAGTVEEALEAVADEPPDAVVLDLMMPGGGGLAVLRALRGGDVNAVPVVVVSAWADTAHRDEAEREGADAFLAKPFDPLELEELVAALLERRHGGADA